MLINLIFLAIALMCIFLGKANYAFTIFGGLAIGTILGMFISKYSNLIKKH